MEFEKVFQSIAVAGLCIFAILSVMNFYNDTYGTSIGSEFNSSLGAVDTLNNVTSISNTMASNSLPQEGAGEESANDGLITRSLRVITVIPTLLGLAPDMIEEGAIILNIPPTYISYAISTFLFTFVALLAYLLLLGVRRLL